MGLHLDPTLVTAVPLYEGVTLSLLTAVSLLAFLGLRDPLKMLPVLLFESLWKLMWLSLVDCSLIVVIAAVTPWGYVWSQTRRATGDRWR